MTDKLGMSLEDAHQLVERSAMKVVELPSSAREEALAVVEQAFRDMYVKNGAGDEQTRFGVETLMQSIRLLIREIDVGGSNGGGTA